MLAYRSIIGADVQFTIEGREFDIHRDQTVIAVRGEQPRSIGGCYLRIECTQYSTEQVILLVRGLHPIDFTSMYANDILSKPGFEVRPIWSIDTANDPLFVLGVIFPTSRSIKSSCINRFPYSNLCSVR